MCFFSCLFFFSGGGLKFIYECNNQKKKKRREMNVLEQNGMEIKIQLPKHIHTHTDYFITSFSSFFLFPVR